MLATFMNLNRKGQLSALNDAQTFEMSDIDTTGQ